MKPVHETIYTPDTPLRNPLQLMGRIVRENWERKELCIQLFWRNIKAQYRQTFFGLLWVFLPAIMSAAVWVFLYSFRVVRFDDPVSQSQYIAYVLTGMILWQSFVEAYSSPLQAFQQNRTMMSKINFPREVILIVATAEAFFNATVRCVVLTPFLFFLQVDFSPVEQLVLFPLMFAGLILTGITIGLYLVPVGALYHDVGRILTMITPIWMMLTPIIYPIPDTFPASLLVYANPASPTLLAARDFLLGNTGSFAGIGAWFVLGLIPVMLVGIVLFRISIPILLERSGS